MRNFEACREAQANGLLRIPVNENPFEKRSGDQIALVGKIVEALRTSACKVEMVKYLVDFHGSPLAPRIQRHTLDTSPILLPLLLREKEIPIDLLCTKGPRDVTSYGDPRNPVIQKSLERAARNTFMDGCPRQKNYSENGEFATTSAKFGGVNPST
jgi:hypothetical protein